MASVQPREEQHQASGRTGLLSLPLVGLLPCAHGHLEPLLSFTPSFTLHNLHVPSWQRDGARRAIFWRHTCLAELEQ